MIRLRTRWIAAFLLPLALVAAPPTARAADETPNVSASVATPPRVLFLNVNRPLLDFDESVLANSFHGLPPQAGGMELTETNRNYAVVVVDTTQLGPGLRRDPSRPLAWRYDGAVPAAAVMGTMAGAYAQDHKVRQNPAWAGRRNVGADPVSHGPPTYNESGNPDAGALPTRKGELNVVVSGSPGTYLWGTWYGKGEVFGSRRYQRYDVHALGAPELAGDILDHLSQHDAAGEVTSINLVSSLAGFKDHNDWNSAAGQKLADALRAEAKRRIKEASGRSERAFHWKGLPAIADRGLEIVARAGLVEMSTFSSPGDIVSVPYTHMTDNRVSQAPTTVIYHALDRSWSRHTGYVRDAYTGQQYKGGRAMAKLVANLESGLADKEGFLPVEVVARKEAQPAPATFTLKRPGQPAISSHETAGSVEHGRPMAKMPRSRPPVVRIAKQ